MAIFKNFRNAFNSMTAFRELQREKRAIVFYAEGNASLPHLMPIINELVERHQRYVSCLVSDEVSFEKLNSENHPLLRPFYIGEGFVRTWLFRNLEAGVCVMTTPDLEQTFLKRSPLTDRYIYVFHSIVSSHMIYNLGAFDHFDTVFCVGPHHEQEIRSTESLYGLPEKSLVAHGYARLDQILRDNETRKPPPNSSGARLNVLVAPSWGVSGIINTVGEELIKHLLEAGFHVTLRPHPMSKKMEAPRLQSIVARYGEHANFTADEDITGSDWFFDSHVMISDWSGAAFEYAFGLERPVLFIDVQRKVNNPEWERLGIDPMEASLRDDVGTILPIGEITNIAACVRNLVQQQNDYKTRIRNLRSKYIYNLGKSAEFAAAQIIAISDDSPSPTDS